MSFIRFFEVYTDTYVLKPLILKGLMKNVKDFTNFYSAIRRILPKPDPRHTLPSICTPSLYHN